MAETSIEWCDFTFNGWEGCEKVSPGCKHCYAEARDRRFHDGAHWGSTGVRRRTSPANWKKPLAWNRAAVQANVVADLAGKPRPPRPRVFCSSLADVFEDRPELAGWRMSLLDLIRKTPHLDWLLLTKRPENIKRLWPTGFHGPGPVVSAGISMEPWPNVWLGTTVEDQQRADERLPALLEVPAVVRFLSCEPLLERVDLTRWLGPSGGIDWVIIGGESGHSARPFHLEWARALVRQCRDADAAPFVKQLGARPMQSQESAMVAAGLYPHDHGPRGRRAEPFSLVDSAGGDPREWPQDLRVREFPVTTRNN